MVSSLLLFLAFYVVFLAIYPICELIAGVEKFSISVLGPLIFAVIALMGYTVFGWLAPLILVLTYAAAAYIESRD